MTGFVSIDRSEVTATVTLSNPERMNALDTTMRRELDVAEFAAVRSNREQAVAYAHVTHAALQTVANCVHPVVAQIHGAFVGGGLEIASMCGMRICGASSRFGMPIKRPRLLLHGGMGRK